MTVSQSGNELTTHNQMDSTPLAGTGVGTDAGAGSSDINDVDSTVVDSNVVDNTVDESPGKRRGVGMIAAFVLLVGFVAFLAIGLQRQNASGQRAAGLAPDFEFTTFEGETITLAELHGQGVVVNFWASWCEPCRTEAELLETTWRREKENGIIFLGIDYLDQEHAAQEYLAEYDITYPNGPDLRSTIARRYRIRGVPETFFISPEGEIVTTKEGPFFSDAELAGYIDEIRPAN